MSSVVAAKQPSASDLWTILFANACEKGTLPYWHLCLSGMVSRGFKASVRDALRLLHTLSFERQCTGGDVMRALGRVSSKNLRFLDFRNCSKISHEHMELILALVREECPGLKRINLEGCRPIAVLCAVALRAKEVFGTASPCELYASIMGLCDGERCALPLLLGQLSGPGAQFELGPEFEAQAADEADDEVFSDYEDDNSSILFMVARLGSAWVMALVLSVKFGEGEVRFDVNSADRHGKRPMHYATDRDDMEMCHLLKDAGADVDEADEQGRTPLLMACQAGNLALAAMLKDGGGNVNEADWKGNTPLLMACQAGNLALAAMLKDAGADVDKADGLGSTPLLIAFATGHLALAQSLVSWGADVRAVRQDGAGLTALALHSQRTDMIEFALKHDPRPDGHIVSHGGSVGSACAEAYLSPDKIAPWLLAGVALRAIVLEIGALMTLPDVDTGIKERLARVRACLDRHHCVLNDTSAWPVAHCIQQLFMQEFGAPDEHNKGAGAAGSGEEKYLIECRNKEELPMSSCFSIPGRGLISSVAFSPDGRLLARAEGNTVVLCCATSAIELRRLCGHR
jgi:hypothetical protein